MSRFAAQRNTPAVRKLSLEVLEDSLTPAYDLTMLDLNTVNGSTAGSSNPQWITPLGNIVIFDRMKHKPCICKVKTFC